MKKKLIPIGITLVLALALFYVMLPALNIQSPEFWIFLFMVIGIYLVVSFLNTAKNLQNIQLVQQKIELPKWLLAPATVFVALVLMTLIYSPIFFSSKYAERIEVNQDGVFEKEVSIVDFNTLPLLDKESSSSTGLIINSDSFFERK